MHYFQHVCFILSVNIMVESSAGFHLRQNASGQKNEGFNWLLSFSMTGDAAHSTCTCTSCHGVSPPLGRHTTLLRLALLPLAASLPLELSRLSVVGGENTGWLGLRSCALDTRGAVPCGFCEARGTTRYPQMRAFRPNDDVRFGHGPRGIAVEGTPRKLRKTVVKMC
jgi:hypothetical protein